MNIKSVVKKLGWTVAFCAFSALSRAEIIEIPDPGLQRAVRVALQKPSGDITRAEMESLTVLDASRARMGKNAPLILSFEGLETAKNLTAFDCSGDISLDWAPGFPEVRATAISDLSPLATLAKLESLFLYDNGLANVALPAGLKSLRVLDLGGNGLTNLSLPAGLTNLSKLDLSYNALESLTLPDDLTSLRDLRLAGSGPTDFNFVNKLPNLRLLDLSYQGKDLQLLAGLTKLEELNVSSSDLSNVVLPATLTNLHTLNLSDNRLRNLDSLAALPSLRSLNLLGNQVTDIPPQLAKLTTLNLANTRVRDFNFLRGFIDLEKLDMSGNEAAAADLGFLGSLPKLRELNLGSQPLRNVVLPQNLDLLESLSIRGAALTNIVLPSPMTHLRSLDLGQNLLTSIGSSFCEIFSCRPEIPTLARIYLDGNRLTTFSLPASASSIEELDLSDNSLTNLALSDMPKLRTLRLWKNKFTRFTIPSDTPGIEELSLGYNQLTTLDLSACRDHLLTLDVSGNPIGTLNFLTDFSKLKSLSIFECGDLDLPPGLSGLTYVGVNIYCPDKCSPDFYDKLFAEHLGIPASMDLEALDLDGFSKDRVTILGLWMHPPIVEADGTLSLQVKGAKGQQVQLFRSANLVDWEPWQSANLGTNGLSLNFTPRGGGREFYRAVPVP